LRSIEVRGHEGEIVRAVLSVEAAAELDAGDLGKGVGSIRLLEGAGEEVLLFQGLGSQARVDAGAA
jgi:hypothetical protein